ncbi:MAG: hypothetical protein AB1716_07380 [Planctomycetota bacterium]
MFRCPTRLVLTAIFVIGAATPVLAEEPPPIQIILDLHMDPLQAFPLQVRPQVYADWRDAAAWAVDQLEPRGARFTFLSVGEYMEYTLEDPASWALIRRLVDGGSLGTHSHREKKYGPHDWRDLPANPPPALVEEMWWDHVTAADQVITAALGITEPNDIRALNNIRGSHLPTSGEAMLALMRQFGFSMWQQGPCERFYAYFEHYAMNPYRPAGHNQLVHDPQGPVVLSPFGPVLGRDGPHAGIYQDMRLPAVQTRFVLEVLNWLDDRFVARTGRVWVTGWGQHGSDIVPGQITREQLPIALDWLKANFIDQPVSGQQLAQFSSARRSRDLYLAWEAAHPGQISFSYGPLFTSWAEYPYLMPVARYLVSGTYETARTIGPVRVHTIVAAPEIGGPFPIHVAYPLGPEPAVVDLTPLTGPGLLAAASPHSGLAPPIPPQEVRVPPTGVILVPAPRRLPLPNGDVNIDGFLNFDDINPFVGVLTGQNPDPRARIAADINRDGVVNFADINPFVALLSGPGR